MKQYNEISLNTNGLKIAGLLIFIGALMAGSTIFEWNGVQFVIGQILNGTGFIIGIFSLIRFFKNKKDTNNRYAGEIPKPQIINSGRASTRTNRITRGKRRSSPMCSTCGAKTESGQTYCWTCGNPL